MSSSFQNSLPAHEIAIPTIVWAIIISFYLYELRKGVFIRKDNNNNGDKEFFSLSFFAKIREGWVIQNHLTGQAAANTTRDYLRVLIFFAGNAILIATVLCGFASNASREPNSPERNLLLAKLSFNVLIFLIIFFCFVFSIRYATHFQ
jgi:hypothetical protein